MCHSWNQSHIIMSEKPILYMNILSPPCRAVLMTGAELGIEFDLKVIDLLGFENKNDDFVKMNPQHTVPFLDDNGVVIVDSHAICAYLSEKYGETDRLYPRDLAKRALCDSRLHFDSGHLFARMRFIYEPILYMKSPEMPEDRIIYAQTVWDIMERWFEESSYACGDEMTIADFCLVASAESLTENAPMDPSKHPKIMKWMERMSQLTYFEELNAAPARDLQGGVREMLKKNAESE
ncbi:glutathione S-transferase 1-1-like [Sitodiplosis mosellana]|uniref:glutathione S-transferase 1-1-like n=1 Tax=Sitodiplosis mosellana TaxID=263140 RepID=UPI002443CB68|nr:glutathione S-transferase 1-1-like [Sitodiplosis mosellana]